MAFPERFSNLPEYAFPRLRALLDHHQPGGEPITMTIGEPRHPMPGFVADVLAAAVAGFARYPANNGTPALLDAISGWVSRRYGVTLPHERLMVLNGTREGLFNAALALCPEQKRGQVPVVLTPNPFYQVYAVAALAVGAEPVYAPATAATGHLPDYAGLPPALLDRVSIAYLCSPANPQGAVASREYWAELLHLAEKHDFCIFADECYAEIYRDTPPPGILEVAQEIGADPERVVSFHSLSKRSNLPGLRSGFVAGGPASIKAIRQLRAYAGAPLPEPLQAVAAAVWADEAHVTASRARYQAKYAIADKIFAGLDGYLPPQAGFFLWLPVKDGEEAALRLWQETGVRVLPGAYLSRETGTGTEQGQHRKNPGAGYVRAALVTSEEDTGRGLTLLRDCLYT